MRQPAKSNTRSPLSFIDHLRRLALAPVSAGAARCLGFLLSIPATRATPTPLAELRNILVVRLDEMGDLVLTAPLIRGLKTQAPQARITLVVRPALVELARCIRGADEVLAFDPLASGFGPRAFRRFFRCVAFARNALRARTYDLALSPRRDADYQGAALLMYFSGATHRIGSPEATTPEKAFWNKGADKLLTQMIPAPSGLHEVDYQLSILPMLGGTISRRDPELQISQHAHEQAAQHLATMPEFSRWIAIAPGAGHPARRWPLDSFVSVARQMGPDTGIVIVGGPQDTEAGALIKKMMPASLDLTGKLSIPETCAIFARCRIALANDSGPAHLAAAMGCPVVVLSCHPADGNPDHANAPVRFAPRSSRSIVLQPPRPAAPCRGFCGADQPHCINQITPGQAYQAIQHLLEEDSLPANCGAHTIQGSNS